MACIKEDSVTAHLNERVVLKLGKDLTLADTQTQVTFVEVLEDSRCPKGTSCIWAGQARVRLKANDGTQLEMTLPGMQEQTEVSATLGGLTLVCYGLAPYPQSGVEQAADAYALFLELRSAP
jgi:hypothetical protein